MSIHSITTKGALNVNEDQHFIHLNGDEEHPNFNKDKVKCNIFCICDGHGGKPVAEFACMKIYKYLTKPGIKYPIKEKVILKVFDEIQKQLIAHPDKIAAHCGTTCLCVVQYQDQSIIPEQNGPDKLENDNTIHLHCESSKINENNGIEHWLEIINLGDCRAVICRNSIAVPLTKDHKPNWPDERRRIKKIGGDDIHYDANGNCWRIKDLSVSRAFGDLDNVPYVTHVPDVFHYKMSFEDQFMILGCDGLWDVVDNQTAVNFVIDHLDNINRDVYSYTQNTINTNATENENIAQKLAQYAIAKGSLDNISIIIVFF